MTGNEPGGVDRPGRAMRKRVRPLFHKKGAASNSTMYVITQALRLRSANCHGLDGLFAGFAGADAHGFIDGEDKNLAVADLAGPGGRDDGVDSFPGDRISHDNLDFYLRQEIHRVLAAPVNLRVALLATEALDLGHRHAFHADGGERRFYLLKLEGLDDGNDEFHGNSSERLPGIRIWTRGCSLPRRGH